jgi:serine/threonine protein kinase
LEIVIDIAYALCHLHTHGVIHRDLKPENILITESHEVKVIDFGIAQMLTDHNDTEAFSQRLIGTPIYMSPEQKQNPESVSYPSDIYSLGIIAYELVIGKLSQGQIHLTLLPKGLQRILNKALQPKPEDRYQDVVDFITDVSAYLNSTNMQKEKKVGDHLSELSENLRNAQSFLAPIKNPNWQDIEIGSANHKGSNTYAVYYDFFAYPNGSYGIIMGESSAKGAEGVIYTAMLRGMVRSLVQTTLSPIELVSSLNRYIVKDNIDQIFTLSYLSLLPKENKVNYISCGYGNLWRIPETVTTAVKISANNLALGIDSDVEFIEVVAPWEPGDLLVLNSYGANISDNTEQSELLESAFRRELEDNANTPPQRIVDAILRKSKLATSRSLQERTLALISILRKQ